MSDSDLSVAQVRRGLAILRDRWTRVLHGEGYELFEAIDLGMENEVAADAFAIYFILKTHVTRRKHAPCEHPEGKE
jgi:hypothetical protein